MSRNETLTLKEARALLDVSWQCSNETLVISMQDWVKELLGPLVADGVPEAKYIFDAIDDSYMISEAKFDQRFLERVTEGARAEIPEAMFYLAHNYYEDGKYEQAAPLYRKAADAGHAYSKWCLGLDLLSGTGGVRDEMAGLSLIEDAAKLHFEGAIQFMVDAYAFGQHSCPKDDVEAAKWQRKLGSKNLISF